jgi:spore coat polysaccharide biosynthesis protein SpsF
MLVHQLERVRQSRLVDKVVVATTTKREDDPIVDLAQQAGVAGFREIGRAHV